MDVARAGGTARRPGMMTIMAVDPEQQAAQEPEQQREWIRQNNVIYGALIAVGLVLVQPFLVSGFAAMMVHSAGYLRLERAAKDAAGLVSGR